MKLSLCVIGCGDFARTFASALSGPSSSMKDDLDLYFASRDVERARTYAEEFGGAGFFGSYAEAAADPRVEALYVCTPHHLHLEHAKLAAQSGKHILLEKPIARNLEEARAIVSAADTGGVTLMVAENYRFLPAVIKAKEMIDEGVLGRLRLVQLQEQYPFQPGAWRDDKAVNGGGVFIDGGIHKASVLAYLAGRPDRVYAAEVPSANPGLAAEDGIVVMTSAADGVVGIINHSWSISQTTARPWVSISGEKANIYFELGLPWLRVQDGLTDRTLDLEDEHRGLATMVREFNRSIRERREPSMTGAEATEDLSFVLTAYESMETGSPLALTPVY